MSTPQKQKKAPKVISIELGVDDQDLIDRIRLEYGLIKYTDCLRLSLRETVRRIESQKQTAAAA